MEDQPAPKAKAKAKGRQKLTIGTDEGYAIEEEDILRLAEIFASYGVTERVNNTMELQDCLLDKPESDRAGQCYQATTYSGWSGEEFAENGATGLRQLFERITLLAPAFSLVSQLSDLPADTFKTRKYQRPAFTWDGCVFQS